MKYRLALCAAFSAAFAMNVHAQNMKPGLWEITTKVQGASGQMEQAMSQLQQQMASMPPEQRRAMEEVLAKQGVKMGPGGPAGGVSVQVCMTREMVERNEFPVNKGDCRTTTQPRTGNTMKLAFSCPTPPSSGEGEITFGGPEAYSMKMSVNTQVQGKPEKIEVAGAGKFLSADCGNVKPLAVPKN